MGAKESGFCIQTIKILKKKKASKVFLLIATAVIASVMIIAIITSIIISDISVTPS